MTSPELGMKLNELEVKSRDINYYMESKRSQREPNETSTVIVLMHG